MSYQKGPTRHAYAWQIGPFWQDTLELLTQIQCATVIFNEVLQQGFLSDTDFFIWAVVP